MNLLTWIIFGLIVGIIANLLDPEPEKGGLIGAIMLGVLGAILGGFLSSLVFGVGISGFNITSLLISTAGALLLLILSRAIRKEY